MILFIAPNPHKAAQREGFLQRVLAIDKLFADDNNLYFEDLSKDEQAKAMIDADMIYVHSVYNANKILKSYPLFAHKIITDLHGVVPEEELYADNHEMVRITQLTEREVFSAGKYFICVTEAMVNHFTKKYELDSTINWIVLPIFNEINITKHKSKKSDPMTIVYAGGGQRWQNVELMVSTINKLYSYYSFKILTYDPAAFGGLSKAARKKVFLKGVPAAQVANYYDEASMGFILRNSDIVNKVACPTKLIEYLAYGVVPIVLSDEIGDFRKFGYSYFTIEELTKIKPDTKAIMEKSENNYNIYLSFIESTNNAKRDLLTLYTKIKRQNKNIKSVQDPLMLLLKSQMEHQETINQLQRYDYQISVYKNKLTEYHKLTKELSSFKKKYREGKQKIRQIVNKTQIKSEPNE